MTTNKKISVINQAVQSDGRHTGTVAKKVRTMLKTKVPDFLQDILDTIADTTNDLTTQQRLQARERVLKLCLDAEKYVDALKLDKKGGKVQEDNTTEGTATVLPYIKTSRK